VANAEEIIDEWIAVTQRGSARPGFPTARKLGRPIPEPRGKLAYALCPCRLTALTIQRFTCRAGAVWQRRNESRGEA